MLFLLHPPVQGLAQWTGTGPSKAFALLSLRRLSGGDLLTIWLGQDGWEYPFHVDYETIWEAETEAIREVADHDPRVRVSIEYKPSEPRAFSLLSDLGMTLLGINDLVLVDRNFSAIQVAKQTSTGRLITTRPQHPAGHSGHSLPDAA